MEFSTDPAWLLSSVVFGVIISVIGTYLVRYLDRNVRLWSAWRSKSRAQSEAKRQTRIKALESSSAARDFYFRNAVWWGFYSVFIGFTSLVAFVLYAASNGLRVSNLFGLGILCMGGVAMYMSFRGWIKASDLLNDITHVDAQRMLKEIDRN